MPDRFALKLSEDILAMVTQLTGAEADVFDDNVFIVLEPLSTTEFKMTLMTEEKMFEAFKNDSELHIMQW